MDSRPQPRPVGGGCTTAAKVLGGGSVNDAEPFGIGHPTPAEAFGGGCATVAEALGGGFATGDRAVGGEVEAAANTGRLWCGNAARGGGPLGEDRMRPDGLA